MQKTAYAIAPVVTYANACVMRMPTGVDAELIFPNKGLLCFTTPDPVFQQAMFRVWNRWARENFAELLASFHSNGGDRAGWEHETVAYAASWS